MDKTRTNLRYLAIMKTSTVSLQQNVRETQNQIKFLQKDKFGRETQYIQSCLPQPWNTRLQN